MGTSDVIFGAERQRQQLQQFSLQQEQWKRQDALNAQNVALQREFAQNGIRWKVEDARAAGISPLAAMGAQGYSPGVMINTDPGPIPELPRSGPAPAEQMVDALKMGQDFGRAMNATRTQVERDEAMYALQKQRAELENTYLAAKIAKETAVGPPLPSAMDRGGLVGQGNVPVEYKRVQINASDPGNPAKEAGAVPDYQYGRTDTGYTVVPSKDVKERIEDNFWQETKWAIRNQLLPALNGLRPPDPRNHPLPKGYRSWEWNPWAQEFQPSKKAYRAPQSEKKKMSFH